MRTADALCATLREAIARHPDVSIDCSAAAEVDLTFIQLLIAARKSARQSGKAVALMARPDGALLHALTAPAFVSSPRTNPASRRFFGSKEPQHEKEDPHRR